MRGYGTVWQVDAPCTYFANGTGATSDPVNWQFIMNPNTPPLYNVPVDYLSDLRSPAYNHKKIYGNSEDKWLEFHVAGENRRSPNPIRRR